MPSSLYKHGTVSYCRLVIAAPTMYLGTNTLLCFEMRVAQMVVMSKIEAKFCTF